MFFCYCKRVCDKKNYSALLWTLFLDLSSHFDSNNTFEDIILIDNLDFAEDFSNFFRETSLISLDVCYDHSYFINLRKAKNLQAHVF